MTDQDDPNPTRPADQELVIREMQTPANLFGTNPVDVMRQAWVISQSLVTVIKRANLSVRIKQQEYLKVEAWTMLGSTLGVFPVVVWTRPIDRPDEAGSTAWGWEACVEARTMAGQVVGRAEAQCTRSEGTWAGRDDYALRGMAQTRATSRAMRGPLGFVVALGGFQATAAEEMPNDG
jgi:hypothetical protein